MASMFLKGRKFTTKWLLNFALDKTNGQELHWKVRFYAGEIDIFS